MIRSENNAIHFNYFQYKCPIRMYHPSLCDSWGTNLYNPFNDTVNCHPLPTEVKNRSQSPG